MTDALTELRAQLANLPADLRARLDEVGFTDEWLLGLAAPLAAGDLDPRTRRRLANQVSGSVRGPAPGEVLTLPSPGSPEARRLTARGEAALAQGEVAMTVLAGGMATRMGGLVKALVEPLPGHSFLALRLQENATLGRRAGRPVPLWLMTSEATAAPTEQALRALAAPAHVRTFQQGFGLRLTPQGTLFLDEHGQPSPYATGHGDLVDALRRSGLLDDFVAQGGRAVMLTNLDNLGATLDPLVIGLFLERGGPLLAEVVEVTGDRGGYPVHAEGRFQVLEEFRLPEGFDTASLPVFSVNTFWVAARPLAEVPIPWHWFEVEKKVGERTAIQFERLVQELTAVLPADYLQVPRRGGQSRFLPVKDWDELARRQDEIRLVAETRGMLPAS